MNLRSINLNLLVVFDALMTENNISRAAHKVGVTPSAVSHALRRLRDTFGDELFERTPDGLAPTQRALDLHRRVRGGLVEIERAVDQQLHFDPRTSERTFRLRIADHFTLCLLPRIAARVRSEAPNITLSVDYLGDAAPGEQVSGIELRICVDEPLAGYRQHRLMKCAFAVAMRTGHPAAAEPLTLESFLSLPYIRASSRSIGASLIDRRLERQGKSRWIAVTVPTLAAVLPVVMHSDLCAILPERWVELYSRPKTLITIPLPIRDIQFTEDMIWHEADDADAGQQWLRAVIHEEFEVLYSPNGGLVKLLGAGPDLLDRIPVKLRRP